MAAPALSPPPLVDPDVARARAAEIERRVFREVFAPRERMSVAQWAEERRWLSPESNQLAADAQGPVKYTLSLTPYHREILEALSDPRTEIVVCELPSQDGKTELANNFIGHRIDVEPGPMLMVLPTVELAKSWSKFRLAPMIRDTPSLRGKVRDARSRDSDNTILEKRFPGGHITAVGGNSPAGLSSRPIRDVIVDEVDRVPRDAGTEGDPIRLAFRRAQTFRRGKKFLISSPTIKGASRIHEEYLLGTQEEMFVPCPHCGEYQPLEFGGRDVAWGIKWQDDDPRTAHYVCRENGCVIEEHHKAWMLDHYRWIAHNPDAGPRRRSFHKTAWASNLVSWSKLVAEWVEINAIGTVEQLQTFINTVNCELWDPLNGKEITSEGLVARLGVGYPPDGTLPPGVAVLTRSVDTQDDRLETALWGWGAGEEAWLIETEILEGSPGTPRPWRALDEVRARTYRFTHGVELKASVTFIDAGGHHSKEVNGYCRTRQAQGVYAIIGATEERAPLLGKPSRNNSAKTIQYRVGSFAGKEALATRLARVTEPGPGYVHLPENLDWEQVQQFTRMRLVSPPNRGGRKWVKPRRYFEERGRVEQYVLYVYALAALHLLGPKVVANLGAIAKSHIERAPARAPSRQLPAPRPRGRHIVSRGIDAPAL